MEIPKTFDEINDIAGSWNLIKLKQLKMDDSNDHIKIVEWMMYNGLVPNKVYVYNDIAGSENLKKVGILPDIYNKIILFIIHGVCGILCNSYNRFFKK